MPLIYNSHHARNFALECVIDYDPDLPILDYQCAVQMGDMVTSKYLKPLRQEINIALSHWMYEGKNNYIDGLINLFSQAEEDSKERMFIDCYLDILENTPIQPRHEFRIVDITGNMLLLIPPKEIYNDYIR